MFKFHPNRNDTRAKMIGEKELEKFTDRDLRCLSHVPVNFDAIGNCYCQCGKKRSTYPCEFANFWYTNISCGGRRDTSSDDILKVDRNAIYLTKKNLTMNQFLEYANSTPAPSAPLKNVKTEIHDQIAWYQHPSYSRLAICTVNDSSGAKKCNNSVKSDFQANNSTPLFYSSSLLLDKRIVSFLRGITLYWFLCLNTVLAKSELVKKKTPIALIDDVNRDSVTSLLDVIVVSHSNPASPFCHSLAQLEVSSHLLEKAWELDHDVLWNFYCDAFVEESQLRNCAVIVVPIDHRFKNNSFEQFKFKLMKVLFAISGENRENRRMPPSFHPRSASPSVRSHGDDENTDYENAQEEQQMQAHEMPPYNANSPPSTRNVLVRSTNPLPQVVGETVQLMNTRGSPQNDFVDIFTPNLTSTPVSSWPGSSDRATFYQPYGGISIAALQPPGDGSVTHAGNVFWQLQEDLLQSINRAYWLWIASAYGDPETNALFARDDAVREQHENQRCTLINNETFLGQINSGANAPLHDILERSIGPRDDANYADVQGRPINDSSPSLHETQEIVVVDPLTPATGEHSAGNSPAPINPTHEPEEELFYERSSETDSFIDVVNVSTASPLPTPDPGTESTCQSSVSAVAPNSISNAERQPENEDVETFARNEAAASPEASAPEYIDFAELSRLSAPLAVEEASAPEYIDVGELSRLSAPLAVGRSTATNGGGTTTEAPRSDSDDNELAELSRPSEAQQPLVSRYHPPQNIAGGNQQNCAQFDMWGTPIYLRMNQSSTSASQQAGAPLQSLRLGCDLDQPAQYDMWSSRQIFEVERLGMERQSADASNATHNRMPSADNLVVAGANSQSAGPVMRGNITLSHGSAFHPYSRQSDDDVALQLRIRRPVVRQPPPTAPPSPPPPSPAQSSTAQPSSDTEDNSDDKEAIPSDKVPEHTFRPLVPAFRVPTDVPPTMLRSASGCEYHQNGHKMFVFKDVESSDPFSFKPKYAVSSDEKACQTDPELTNAFHVARPRHSPTSQGWPSPHQPQPAHQVTSPFHAQPAHLATSPYLPQPAQYLAQPSWSSFRASVPAATTTAVDWTSWQPAQLLSRSQPPLRPPSQSHPTSYFPSQAQPMPASQMSDQQPTQHLQAVLHLQTYSLNDVFSHLGRPGLANVSQQDLSPPPATSTF